MKKIRAKEGRKIVINITNENEWNENFPLLFSSPSLFRLVLFICTIVIRLLFGKLSFMCKQFICTHHRHSHRNEGTCVSHLHSAIYILNYHVILCGGLLLYALEWNSWTCAGQDVLFTAVARVSGIFRVLGYDSCHAAVSHPQHDNGGKFRGCIFRGKTKLCATLTSWRLKNYFCDIFFSSKRMQRHFSSYFSSSFFFAIVFLSFFFYFLFIFPNFFFFFHRICVFFFFSRVLLLCFSLLYIRSEYFSYFLLPPFGSRWPAASRVRFSAVMFFLL